MEKRLTKLVVLIISLSLMFASVGLAQEFEQQLTQEDFAVELVTKMKLESSLPLAALPSDCVNLLERLGISPLNGWDNTAYLAKEDYLVLLAKAHGKEEAVHELAEAVEIKNIEVINEQWEKSNQDLGRWLTVDELLADTTYFSDGPPKSPYGHTYEDKDGDHKIDRSFLPAVGLMKLRKRLSGYGKMP